ncbi:hypothetical protein [Terricaulis sp.]|uniref:hypothetical protein n=1 Tax=Terricaulis sp. TaxID=2768686 RepID=UPI003784DB6C
MRVWLKALCAGAMALTLAAPAAAQDFQTQVRGYLEHGMGPHAALGYRRDPGTPDLNVPLQLERPYIWPVYLRAGENYRIYAACDDDCSDLDMEVYGADGNLVDRDVATDDTPYVQITPATSGRAYVRIWVYACENEPCYTAARVVVGGSPTERPSDADQTARTSAEDMSGIAANNEYTQLVLAELNDAGAPHEQAGYQRFSGDVIQPLTLDASGHTLELTLNAGTSYLFQGACDQDCTDVDMEILDPRGRQMALDVESNDRPTVAVEPRQTGAYRIRIWLAQCSVEPCYAGVRSYRRGR